MTATKDIIIEQLSVNWLTTVLVFFTTFILASFTYGRLQRRHLPPGLPRLPIIGSLLYLWRMKQDHTTYQTLAKRFGPIFCYYLGNWYWYL